MKSHLKKYRQLKNYSQEQLAEKVGVARQSIYAIEVGKFTPTMLLGLKLAKILEVSVYDLFELEESD
ncbi:MAG: helix-turn-helix transcriptional regulator [bacterium]|nr:helix-turn-helix transcriptional regulator [bacterium]